LSRLSQNEKPEAIWTGTGIYLSNSAEDGQIIICFPQTIT